MIADARQKSIIEALRSDDGVERLARGLAYSDRFHFFLLVCDMPRVADAVLELLRDEVPKEREEPVRFVVLDPYRAHADLSKPIPYDLLVNEVLARLAAPLAEERAADVVFVVDASRAVKQDDESWTLMFQRMNERRNVISEALAGPLLLVVPERLEPTFAHAAPDFWSIRSTAVVVRLPKGEREGLTAELPKLGDDGRYDADSEQVSAKEIQREVAALRARLEANPRDEEAENSLLIWLARLVDHERSRGTLDSAQHAAEEMLRLARARMERDPESSLAQVTLAVSLMRAGAVAREAGDHLRSRAAYEEGVGLFRDLCRTDPEALDLRVALAAALNAIGDFEEDAGELQRAIHHYREAYSIAIRIHETNRDRVDWQDLVVRSLNRIGNVSLRIGDHARALAAYELVRENAREALERQPASTQAMHDLSVGHMLVGNAYRSMGALPLALIAYEESLSLAERLRALEPHHREWIHLTSKVLFWIGESHQTMGDAERASAVIFNGINLLREELRRDPARVEAQRELAIALARRAEAAESMGRLGDALTSLREANAIFQAMGRERGLPPLWQHNADLCRVEIARLEATLASRSPS